jgi:hypothetical protein
MAVRFAAQALRVSFRSRAGNRNAGFNISYLTSGCFNDCAGGGTCADGLCACPPGRAGARRAAQPRRARAAARLLSMGFACHRSLRSPGADCSIALAPLLTLPVGGPGGAPAPVAALAQSASGTLPPGGVAYWAITVPDASGQPAFGGAAAPPPSLLLELTLPQQRAAGGAGGAGGGGAAPLLLLLNATSPASLASAYVAAADGTCDAALGCHWAVEALPAPDAPPRVTLSGRCDTAPAARNRIATHAQRSP